VYPITQPAEWFRKLGPYLEKLISLLKHAAPLAGPVLGIAVEHLDSQLKADCDLMKELANQLPSQLPDKRTLDQLEPVLPTAHAANDADFRALETMFAKLDPDKTWGGLSKTSTPEGLTLYLCHEHAAPYRRPPA
jgi:internalin A